ncbi:YchJ family metal-binding protein [Chromatium okenii]|uniref:YchJ family metal-binding protein n=1 Tax=Chromatium okenii TaxID=61644 RepID=UPI001F5BBD85|nr:YchJ family metal-binding protein [Chromatium okenii]
MNAAPLFSLVHLRQRQRRMRSRYTAYAVGQLDHLERTDAPEARDEFNRADAERTAAETRGWA